MSKKKVVQMQRRKDELELLSPDSDLVCKRCDEKLLSEMTVTLMAADGFVNFELYSCHQCGQKYVMPGELNFVR